MADRYWVNDNNNGLWNDAQNWASASGGCGPTSVPGTSDNVYFDGAGTYGDTNCTYDVASSVVNSISLSGSFTATLDINGNILGSLGAVTLGAGELDISAGSTFAAIGAFSATGGTLTVAGTGEFTTSANVTLGGGASYSFGSGISFTGSNNQTITTNGTDINKITIDKNAASDTIFFGDAVSAAEGIIVTMGHLNWNGNTFTSLGGGIDADSADAELTIDATTDIMTNMTLNASGAYTITGTVQFTGAGTSTLTSAGKSFANVSAAKSSGGTFSLGSDLECNDFTIGLGNFDSAGYDIDSSGDVDFDGTGTIDVENSTINVEGDLSFGSSLGTVTTAGSEIVFDGSSASTLTTSDETLNDVTLNKGSITNTVTLQDDFTCDGTVTVTTGKIVQDGNAIVIGGDFDASTANSGCSIDAATNIVGSFTLSAFGDHTVSGTITFSGAGTSILTSAGIVLGSISSSKSGTLELGGNLVATSLSTTSGNFDMGGFNLTTSTTIQLAGSGDVTLDGDIGITGNGSFILYSSGSVSTIQKITVSGTGNILISKSGVTISEISCASASKQTSFSGTPTLTINKFTANGGIVYLDASTDTLINVTGASDVNITAGTTINGNGDFTFNTAAAVIATIENVAGTFKPEFTTTSTGTWQLSGDCSSGEILITSGNFDFNGFDYETTSDFLWNSSGTLTLDGNYTMSGDGDFTINNTGSISWSGLVSLEGDGNLTLLRIALLGNLSCAFSGKTTTVTGRDPALAKLVLGAGQFDTNSYTINLRPSVQDAYSFDDNSSIIGGGLISLASNASITLDIPRIYAPASILYAYNGYSGTNTFNFTGDINVDELKLSKSVTYATTFNFVGINTTVTANYFKIYSSSGTTDLVVNLGVGEFVIENNVDFTYSVVGDVLLNMGMSELSISGDWIASTVLTVDEGTSTIIASGTLAQEITSEGQSFYNFTNNNSSDSVSFLDSSNIVGEFKINTDSVTEFDNTSSHYWGSINTDDVPALSTCLVISDVSGSSWDLTIGSNQTVENIYVQDSNLTGYLIYVSGGTDGGNNSENWIFGDLDQYISDHSERAVSLLTEQFITDRT